MLRRLIAYEAEDLAQLWFLVYIQIYNLYHQVYEIQLQVLSSAILAGILNMCSDHQLQRHAARACDDGPEELRLDTSSAS